MSWPDNPIIAHDADVEIHMLDPTAGFGAFERLGEDLRPVVERPCHVPQVDVIECVGSECPFEPGVVDLELYVGGDPVGLNGRDVYADYFGRGVFVCEISICRMENVSLGNAVGDGRGNEECKNSQGPDSSAGPDIEYLLGILEWCEVKLAFEDKSKQMVTMRRSSVQLRQ